MNNKPKEASLQFRASAAQMFYGFLTFASALAALLGIVLSSIQQHSWPQTPGGWGLYLCLVMFCLWAMYLGVEMFLGTGHYKRYLFVPVELYIAGVFMALLSAFLTAMMCLGRDWSHVPILVAFYASTVGCFVLAKRRSRKRG